VGGVLDRLVLAHPSQRDVIYGTAELHRQFARRAAPAASGRRLGPGDQLGPFEIVRLLRRGGMGEVYLARQTALDRLVALKVIRRGFISPIARAKFAQENQVLARLHHSNIVPVHFTGEDGGLQYCVMHLVDGVPLDEVIAEVGRRVSAGAGVSSGVSTLREAVGAVPTTLDPTLGQPSPPAPHPVSATPAPSLPPSLSPGYCGEVADLVAQAAKAIQHAHASGVCHRDLKPSNLLVDRHGKLWVIDFGLAGVVRRPDDTSETHPPPPADALDWRTTLGGTPQYMPPEQFHGHTDERSDVYSLGLVLFELLTTRPAFPRGDWATVERQVKAAGPLDPQALVPSVPTDLAAIVRKATAREPSRRYQSAADFAADLRRWREGMPTAARPLGPLTRLWMWVRRHPWPTAAVGAVFAAVLAAVAGVASGQVLGARADAAEARGKASEERAERGKAEFARAVLEVQRDHADRPHRTGWVKEVQRKLTALLAARPGGDLRDQAADTLGGLDASPVCQWPAAGGAERWGGYAAVAFSPDGTKVVAGGWGQPRKRPSFAAVWDGNIANKPVPTTRGGAGGVAFPDADSPLTLLPPVDGETGPVLWNVGTHTKVLDLPLPAPGGVGQLTLSADARSAAAVFTPDRPGEKVTPRTLLWAIDRKAGTSATVGDWPGDSTALAFSSDGRLLATGTAGGVVTVRTAADGKPLFDLHEGGLPVTGLAFGRNFRLSSAATKEELAGAAGWQLGIGSQGGDLSVWDLRTRTRTNPYRGSSTDVFGVAFSPDGTTLVSSGRYEPTVWDVASARPLLRVTDPKVAYLRNWTEGVAVSPAGDRLAFGSGDPFNEPGGLDVFRLDADRGVRTYRGLSGVVERVWLSADGKHVAALAHNWQLGVWERDAGRVKFVWDTPAGWTPDNAAVAFDGDTLLFASGSRATRWSLTGGTQTDSWDLPRGLNDHFLLRPGKPPLLLRNDPGDQKGSPWAIRARELLPDGKLAAVYDLGGEKLAGPELRTVSADGRMLVWERGYDPARSHLFDGLTGKRIPVESEWTPAAAEFSLSDSGRVVWATERLTANTVRTHAVRLADQKRVATHPDVLNQVDDAGKLGLLSLPLVPTRPWDNGVALYRVGDDRPLVTFDLGRPPVRHRISGDGEVVSWGRRDGTVCVADVNKCLETLAEFGKR
jgi:serine/threonine protein kinase/WD40 repeat protein